jgi:hypothetical protein
MPTAREGWDTADKSPALERFYRELMAVEKLPSRAEVAQQMIAAVNREDVDTRQLTALIDTRPGADRAPPPPREQRCSSPRAPRRRRCSRR